MFLTLHIIELMTFAKLHIIQKATSLKKFFLFHEKCLNIILEQITSNEIITTNKFRKSIVHYIWIIFKFSFLYY